MSNLKIKILSKNVNYFITFMNCPSLISNIVFASKASLISCVTNKILRFFSILYRLKSLLTNSRLFGSKSPEGSSASKSSGSLIKERTIAPF